MNPSNHNDPSVGRARTAVFAPLYRQIKDLLVAGLDRGEWKPGDPIPSEQDLATRFQVSQGTVRKAVDELASANLLVRRQGKGTFVATHHEPRAQYRFLSLQPDAGEAVPAESRFLQCRRIKAPADIAHLLGLKISDPVIFVERVLDFAGVPIVLDEIWLPGGPFKGLTADRLAKYRGPLYGLYETEFAMRMIRAEERIRAVAAEQNAAVRLAVPLNAPLLLVERLSFTYGDRPVEVRRGLYLTTRHHYRNSLY